MAQYTSHYGLHQWEPEDSFLREDFNQDLARIDTALAEKADAALLEGKCGIVTGTYTGDDTLEREIQLGFRPRAVLLQEQTQAAAILAVEGGPVQEENSGKVMLKLTEHGFQVKYDTYQILANSYICKPYTNRAGKVYFYAAFQ